MIKKYNTGEGCEIPENHNNSQTSPAGMATGVKVEASAQRYKDMAMEISAFNRNNGIHIIFNPHWVHSALGLAGVGMLIAWILQKNQAVLPKGIETLPDQRQTAIEASLFVEEIIQAVRSEFGFDRYPDRTIFQYLSVFMFRAGIVGKIKLNGVEDKHRACCKPRTKFYLVKPEDPALN